MTSVATTMSGLGPGQPLQRTAFKGARVCVNDCDYVCMKERIKCTYELGP